MIGHSKWDLDTPALLVDLAAMDRNIERMARTFRQAGVGWRPHTQAIKIPAIAHKLLRAGALGITCAKVSEAEVMVAAGIGEILIANQVVGEAKIARLVNLLPRADPVVAVDNPANVLQLDRAARAKGLPLRVVVEVNVGMDRAGAEPDAALGLSKFVNECQGLRYSGLMGWEGHTTCISDQQQKRQAVDRALRLLTAAADRCREVLPVEIVSCGGTGTYQISAWQSGVTEIQAGGGIFGDVRYHDAMQVGHECALTVLATVSSRPTPSRIIADAGKKTMSSDGGVPRPLIDAAVTSVTLSSEQARIELDRPSASPRLGDKIEFIVGCTDTTTMLHDELYGTRDGHVEVIWPILGRGKLQ